MNLTKKSIIEKEKEFIRVPLGFNLKIDETAQLEEMIVDRTKNFNKRNKKWLIKNDDDSTMVMTTIRTNVEMGTVE